MNLGVCFDVILTTNDPTGTGTGIKVVIYWVRSLEVYG
jgi:hypothetical protein